MTHRDWTDEEHRYVVDLEADRQTQAQMVPVHDHFEARSFNALEHDVRCTGDCHPCGGEGGAYGYTCLTCGGTGECPGCLPTELLPREQHPGATRA